MDRNVVTATVLIGLIMMVWLYWLAPPAAQQQSVDSTGVATGIPEVVEPEEAAPLLQSTLDVVSDSVYIDLQQGEEQLITVESDLYTAVLSTKGATIKSFILKEYKRHDRESQVQLIEETDIGALALVFTSPSSQIVDTRALYFDTDVNDSTVEVNAEREIVFTATIGQGVLRQVYTFAPDSYEISMRVEREQYATYAIRDYEVVWDGGLPFAEANSKTEGPRTGAFARTGGSVEELRLLKKAYEEKLLSGQVDWVAVKNQYFTAVIMPQELTAGAEVIGERTAEPGDSLFAKDFEIGLRMPASADGAEVYTLYLGPIDYFKLRTYKLGLYDMVDYGINFFEWMTRPLAKFIFIPLFRLLEKFIPSYGIIIIVLSLLMKVALYPFTKSSYRNMARMRDLQPRMAAIKEKFADNPQKQQEATMKMYKETGVNPLGGCLPMLLQYPVIIALWQFLPQSLEIRQQGFLWASDLSAPDSILDLPFEIPFYGNFVAGFTLLMGLSMVVQMRMQSGAAASNPQMKMFTYIFPVMIFAIFNRFASGLSLYYLCFNVLTAGQQKWINHTLEKEKAANGGVMVNGKAKAKAKKAAAAKGKKKSGGSSNGRDKKKRVTK